MSKKHKDHMRRLQSGQDWPTKPAKPGFREQPKQEQPPAAPPVKKDDDEAPTGIIPNSIIWHNGANVWSYPYIKFPWGTDLAERQNAIDQAKIELLKSASPRIVKRAVPDGIIPLTTWRAWKTAERDGEWRLSALGVSSVWYPKKPMEATCKGGGSARSHPAPNKNCECGIWSFRSLEHLLEALKGYNDVRVIGQVTIWGRIIECENGFRSQYAYPKELWLLDGSLEQLGYIYGVPVRTA